MLVGGVSSGYDTLRVSYERYVKPVGHVKSVAPLLSRRDSSFNGASDSSFSINLNGSNRGSLLSSQAFASMRGWASRGSRPTYDGGRGALTKDEEGAKDSAELGAQTKESTKKSEKAKEEIAKLQSRDVEVKSHEAAHMAAGGSYAGGASYTYEKGADGRSYAIAGEVPIDMSPIAGDPQATIQKMRTVMSAALAPADPSGADRSVAASARQAMVAAEAQLARKSEQVLKAYSKHVS